MKVIHEFNSYIAPDNITKQTTTVIEGSAEDICKYTCILGGPYTTDVDICRAYNNAVKWLVNRALDDKENGYSSSYSFMFTFDDRFFENRIPVNSKNKHGLKLTIYEKVIPSDEKTVG